ncbi:MAG: hypothetical protein JST35_02025 [Armatimonadetes bacterium]|jgi:hypothetical protein|nr:hypothetical protein [Armatimonadota bacterium]
MSNAVRVGMILVGAVVAYYVLAWVVGLAIKIAVLALIAFVVVNLVTGGKALPWNRRSLR